MYKMFQLEHNGVFTGTLWKSRKENHLKAIVGGRQVGGGNGLRESAGKRGRKATGRRKSVLDAGSRPLRRKIKIFNHRGHPSTSLRAGSGTQGKPLRCHAAAAFFWIEGSMELRAAVAAAGCTGPSSGLRFVRMTSGGGLRKRRISSRPALGACRGRGCRSCGFSPWRGREPRARPWLARKRAA